MSGRKAPRTTLIELAIVASICGGLVCLLWPVVRDLRGPAGDPIPGQPPDEANRLHHPAGFSMVVPPDWGSHITTGLEPFPEEFSMAPLTPGRSARRSRALIVVSRIGQPRPSSLGSLRRTDFLGHEAYEGMRVVRGWTFDDGAWSEYLLFLRHGEAWYAVRYGIAEERTTLPGIIRQYLNTLRWDERRPGPPRGGRAAVPGSSGALPRDGPSGLTRVSGR